MNPEVYRLFDLASPVIVIWLSGFVCLTMGLLVWRWKTGQSHRHRESLIGGELPGILLVLMHSVCFAYSLYMFDWWSVLIFGWWGPGFLVIATMVLLKRPISWQKIAKATSMSCKLNYLILVGVFWFHGSCVQSRCRLTLTLMGQCGPHEEDPLSGSVTAVIYREVWVPGSLPCRIGAATVAWGLCLPTL